MGDTRGSIWATDDAIRQLRECWANPALSSSEIGRRFGVSKNAIVGKVHRLGLEPRPSPILPRSPSAPTATPAKPIARTDVPTLAPLASLGPLAASPPPAWAPPPVVERIAARPVHVAPVKPAPAPIVPRVRTEPCCWVTAEGGRGKPWLYCNDESAPGKPFCARHSKLAYVKIRDRSEDAAHAMGGD